jgi:hypothetical protein
MKPSVGTTIIILCGPQSAIYMCITHCVLFWVGLSALLIDRERPECMCRTMGTIHVVVREQHVGSNTDGERCVTYEEWLRIVCHMSMTFLFGFYGTIEPEDNSYCINRASLA